MAYAESKHQITLIIEVTISLFELGQIALEDGTEVESEIKLRALNQSSRSNHKRP